jgi:hypothetical protein
LDRIGSDGRVETGGASFVKPADGPRGAGGYLFDLNSGIGVHVTGTDAYGNYIPAHSVNSRFQSVNASGNVQALLHSPEAIVDMLDLDPIAGRPGQYSRRGFRGTYTMQQEADGTFSVFFSGGSHQCGRSAAPQTFHHGYWDNSRRRRRESGPAEVRPAAVPDVQPKPAKLELPPQPPVPARPPLPSPSPSPSQPPLPSGAPPTTESGEQNVGSDLSQSFSRRSAALTVAAEQSPALRAELATAGAGEVQGVATSTTAVHTEEGPLPDVRFVSLRLVAPPASAAEPISAQQPTADDVVEQSERPRRPSGNTIDSTPPGGSVPASPSAERSQVPTGGPSLISSPPTEDPAAADRDREQRRQAEAAAAAVEAERENERKRHEQEERNRELDGARQAKDRAHRDLRQSDQALFTGIAEELPAGLAQTPGWNGRDLRTLIAGYLHDRLLDVARREANGEIRSPEERADTLRMITDDAARQGGTVPSRWLSWITSYSSYQSAVQNGYLRAQEVVGREKTLEAARSNFEISSADLTARR